MNRLGLILKRARGKQSRVQFARKLGLSYTFVRAMEHGLRFPSDKVLLEIAERLKVDPGDLLMAAYCDRSPQLAEVLEQRGLQLPEEDQEVLARDAAEAEHDEVDEVPAVRPSEERPNPAAPENPIQISRRF
ncbi:MAG: helix-turn-helix transcriptional regulator [Planctomycetes bacterium]|nr:helix-turn-helix transcriptional regulator [Planctomycetota bacterium]